MKKQSLIKYIIKEFILHVGTFYQEVIDTIIIFPVKIMLSPTSEELKLSGHKEIGFKYKKKL